MCLGLYTSKQQDDKPELNFANSEIDNIFIGNSIFSAKILLDSGISSCILWINVPLIYNTLAASSSGTVNV
jgi:hypothetical protein